MPIPATADVTATPSATPSATLSVIHPVPTQPLEKMQAGGTAGDQHVAPPVTAGMPASSVIGADAAALSSQAPSEQSDAHASTALPVAAAAASADAVKPPAPLESAGEEQRGSIPSGNLSLGPSIERSSSDAMDTS